MAIDVQRDVVFVKNGSGKPIVKKLTDREACYLCNGTVEIGQHHHHDLTKHPEQKFCVKMMGRTYTPEEEEYYGQA